MNHNDDVPKSIHMQESIMSEKNPKKIAKFVKKLSRLMCDAQPGVCEWSRDGDSFILYKGEAFGRLLFVSNV